MSYINQRIEFLDLAKGIGIILVVIGHSISSDNLIGKWIYSFHMPLFFLISGMCFFEQRYRFFIPFFHKRMKELFLPFVYFTLLLSILSLMIFDDYPIEDLRYGAPGALWFLNVLFISEIIYFYIDKYARIYAANRIILLLLILVISIGLDKLHIHLIYNLSSVFLAMFFYGIGHSYRSFIIRYVQKISRNKRISLFILILFFLVPAIVVFLTDETISCAGNNIPSPLIIFLIMPFMGVFGIFLFTFFIKNTTFKKILLYLGQNTLIIMCLHMFFIGVSSTYLLPYTESQLLYKIGEQLFVWILVVGSIELINHKIKFLIGK